MYVSVCVYTDSPPVRLLTTAKVDVTPVIFHQLVLVSESVKVRRGEKKSSHEVSWFYCDERV